MKNRTDANLMGVDPSVLSPGASLSHRTTVCRGIEQLQAKTLGAELEVGFALFGAHWLMQEHEPRST